MMVSMSILSSSPEATFAVGQEIGRRLLGQRGLVYLTGDIGAGKTAISKGIVSGYGYPGRVTSPTFSLVNRYVHGDKCIFHMDLYRLSDADELFEIGFEEMAAAPHPVLIEWPEILNDEGFEPILVIDLARTEDESLRKITLSSKDERLITGLDAFVT